MKILKTCSAIYAEDETTASDHISKLLKLFFNRVYTFDNGLSALEFYQQHGGDVLILDILMPAMDGLEVARHIRETDSNVPIFITSAHIEKSYLLEAIKIGLVDYLEKPISYDKVKNVLNRCARELHRLRPTSFAMTNDINFYPDKLIVTNKNQIVQLTKKERDLLLLFCQAPNTIIPAQILFEKLWDTGKIPTENALRNLLLRIRKKIGEANLIKSISGVGYMLVVVNHENGG